MAHIFFGLYLQFIILIVFISCLTIEVYITRFKALHFIFCYEDYYIVFQHLEKCSTFFVITKHFWLINLFYGLIVYACCSHCIPALFILPSFEAQFLISFWSSFLNRLQTLKGHGRKVSSCASDRQGKLIVSGGLDCFVFVWRAASGEKLCDFNIGR